MTRTPSRRPAGAALVAAAAALLLAVTGCSSSDASSGGKLSLVAFSVPKPAYEALTTAFTATDKGKGVSWASSYGASGTQSQSVSNGQEADFVALSLEPDMTKLVPKFVDPSWNSGPTKGMVSSSVVVFAVRKGNPLQIKGWDDLIKTDVDIVTPDPGSSGGAKWNVLAAYSYVLANGGTEAQAQDYLKAFFANVVSKPSSAANATSTFLNGTGDVLLSYENEAIAARQKGQPLDYVVPAESILIENPGAVTKTAPQAAKDFLEFVRTETGQQVFVEKGFRPVIEGVPTGSVAGANDPANPFPPVAKLQTIADLGGWSAVNKKYFDKGSGIVTRIISGAGG
ncbi:MAG TPA: sulfate ABC transporter substrate-binding protein [Jatrophihabitans sp.]|jgi:sulfate transport system substrate-binding protein|uniref:sulfate ABC transporter substrate-binding protein n=1 Tax=Jatrophihabitans sp. TaxID=1932789 RepID=UPI002F195063